MPEKRGAFREAFGRMFRPENRRRAIRRGTLEHLRAFPSTVLGNQRDITIYLPAGYAEHPDARYPVLYKQDGQNLFEPERAFIPGQHWRLAEAADEAIFARTARPMIIVGIDNTGVARIDEYTPSHDVRRKAGGRADDYARFLIEELKPAIDAGFRTLPDAANTSVGGSSLGGLLSLDLGLEHPEAFSAVAAMSPSVWWDGRRILEILDAFRSVHRPRIWLDIGGREGREALDDVRLLRDRLIAKGWRLGTDLHYYEDRRADHSERAWAQRAKAMLEFLLPPQA
jgi:predicted alpha/beta superfamily hydrolase